MSAPGVFTYTFVFRAVERINITLLLGGALVDNSVLLNISAVLPSAVNVTACLKATSIQRDGELTRTTWDPAGAPLGLLAYSWHLLYVPVLLFNRTGPMFADPKLAARLNITGPVVAAAAAANSTNTTAAAVQVTAPSRVFSGYWSSSNGSYVIPFKLPDIGTFSGSVDLLPPSTNGTSNTTTLLVSCFPQFEHCFTLV